MRLIERYILRSFLKVFLALLATIAVLIAIIEILDRYPDMAEYRPPFVKVLSYVLYSLPQAGGYLLPMVTLLSIIYSLGLASKHREILIISASGGRLRSLFKPLVVTGLLITLMSAVLTNIIMPESKRLSRLKLEEITGEPRAKGLFESSQGIWFRSENRIIRIGIYEPGRSEARDIGVYELDKGNLLRRIEAEEGSLKEKEWTLRDVRIYDRTGGEKNSIHYKEFKLGTSRYTLRLLRAEVAPEEMDSSRLWRFIRALRKSGLRNIKVVADFNLRLSLPFASLAMLLTGIYLGVNKSISGLMGAGIGIVISIFFWFSTTFMLSLGYSGVLPPWFAPWITPLSALMLSVYLYRKIE